MREINHLRGLIRNDPLGVQASACALRRLDSPSVSICVHPWLDSFSTTICGKSTTCVEISDGRASLRRCPDSFRTAPRATRPGPHFLSDIIRLFPNFSDAPQPIVFSQTTTTIRRTDFPPHFCAEKKIYPVPGGPRRSQAVPAGTAAAVWVPALQRVRPLIPHFTPHSAFRISQVPLRGNTRQYADAGQFLAAYCRLSVRVLPRVTIFLPRLKSPCCPSGRIPRPESTGLLEPVLQIVKDHARAVIKTVRQSALRAQTHDHRSNILGLPPAYRPCLHDSTPICGFVK